VTLGYDKPLYMLALDHRASFQKDLFGIAGTPTAEEGARITDTKRLIYEGFELAAGNVGGDVGSLGILVDEQFGAEIARDARSAGYALAMPAEKSGQAEFDFEYGNAFHRHIEDFDPAFVKVLVRYNPADPAAMRARQVERLAGLSYWLRNSGRKFLFELLVPPSESHMRTLRGDFDLFDRKIRPQLVVDSIHELHHGGVEPDIWKIEGLHSRADCVRVAEAARSGGRDGVSCIVLGRGAGEERVTYWVEQAAGVSGYTGFAVGRTLWFDVLKAYTTGRLGREEAAEQITDNFERMVTAYETAAFAAA
jgi:myo-inositol catabolism protein IolC